MMARLILPDTSYFSSYCESLREGYFLGSAEPLSHDEIRKIESDPYAFLDTQNRQGGFLTPADGIPCPLVKYNIYWLVDDKEFIGGISLRYELNDFLRKHAGHIGYGIRPSKQRMGYARMILSMGLDLLAQQGLTSAMVTADNTNIGSWRAIEANGGVLTGTLPSVFKEGETTRTYQIDMSKRKVAA